MKGSHSVFITNVKVLTPAFFNSEGVYVGSFLFDSKYQFSYIPLHTSDYQALQMGRR